MAVPGSGTLSLAGIYAEVSGNDYNGPVGTQAELRLPYYALRGECAL